MVDAIAEVRPWITSAEAARLHVTDMRPALDDEDARALLLAAKKRISRACQSGQVRCTGVGFDRRVDPDSLDAWRIHMRQRDLNREN
jgi:hypothetical protein